jgi:hypothetical protein
LKRRPIVQPVQDFSPGLTIRRSTDLQLIRVRLSQPQTLTSGECLDEIQKLSVEFVHLGAQFSVESLFAHFATPFLRDDDVSIVAPGSPDATRRANPETDARPVKEMNGRRLELRR